MLPITIWRLSSSCHFSAVLIIFSSLKIILHLFLASYAFFIFTAFQSFCTTTCSQCNFLNPPHKNEQNEGVTKFNCFNYSLLSLTFHRIILLQGNGPWWGFKVGLELDHSLELFWVSFQVTLCSHYFCNFRKKKF